MANKLRIITELKTWTDHLTLTPVPPHKSQVIVFILQVLIAKTCNPSKYDNFVPMVDKVVDASWPHNDKFAVSKGIYIDLSQYENYS